MMSPSVLGAGQQGHTDNLRAAPAPSTPAQSPSLPSVEAQLGIDQFSYYAGFVVLRGWVRCLPQRALAVTLQIEGRAVARTTDCALPSLGAPEPAIGFELIANTAVGAFDFREPSLHVDFDDGHHAVFTELGVREILQDRGHRLFPEFVQRIRGLPAGRLLEIGSRARSGVSRREVAPADWGYVGLDIVEGVNVDVVGDAHSMSSLLPHDSFDAAMSLSVFEHLAMPWKVVLELNKLLKVGGIAFIQTHQAFPLHDEPWDFWRVSAHAWPVLFNAKTGFRVLEAAMAEPVHFVARRWHMGMNLHESCGYAVSSVLVEKTGRSALSWDVDLADCLDNRYPA